MTAQMGPSRMHIRMISAVVGLAVVASPLPALAESASSLRDLVGARAAGAEQDLRSRSKG